MHDQVPRSNSIAGINVPSFRGKTLARGVLFDTKDVAMQSLGRVVAYPDEDKLTT